MVIPIVKMLGQGVSHCLANWERSLFQVDGKVALNELLLYILNLYWIMQWLPLVFVLLGDTYEQHLKVQPRLSVLGMLKFTHLLPIIFANDKMLSV